MVYTLSPTTSWSLSPRVTGCRPVASIFRTATSLSCSPPTRVAVYLSPLAKETSMDTDESFTASSITW